MTPIAPPELQARAAQWEDLSRWERAELGRALRRLGWSYGEIRTIIPVPKGTLAGWCRDVVLSADQVAEIRRRTGQVKGVPRNTQWRRRREIAEIRAAALGEVEDLLNDPLWLAGTVLYWAEGNKRDRHLAMTNTDPAILRFFMQWVKRFLIAAPGFVLSLHLHAENDESAAKRHWSTELDLHNSRFSKTYWKKAGTGQRNNRLSHGVCRVRVCRGTDALIRTRAWISVLQRTSWIPQTDDLLSSSAGR